MKKLFQEFKKGITKENPIFYLALGLCPALAVSNSLKNAFGMGLAATFVLFFSNTIISLIRKTIPDKIRIPCFIVIIATFVTIVELTMKAYFPDLNKALGIFIPLIVVNCIILGRAEAFASRNSVLLSMADGLGMGIGFTLALMVIAGIREFLGNGTLFGLKVIEGFEPAATFVLAPGALLVVGLIIGGIRWIKSSRS